MRMKRTTIAMLAATVCLSFQVQAKGDPWRIPAKKEKFHIFLLMGQSNMAGGSWEPLTQKDKTPEPGIVYIPFMSQKW